LVAVEDGVRAESNFWDFMVDFEERDQKWWVSDPPYFSKFSLQIK
jgi:hypothetical protein